MILIKGYIGIAYWDENSTANALLTIFNLNIFYILFKQIIIYFKWKFQNINENVIYFKIYKA